MEFFKEFIQSHAHIAHWYLFGAILLAGFNIPISADLLIFLAALLAATIIPEHTVLLFSFLLAGCYLSALIAYFVGRFLGTSLMHKKWFAKIFSEARLQKIRAYYEKHGVWVLILGRFIPFGVRNCIFMSSGMSRLSLKKFMLIDAIGCTAWFTSLFFLFFTLGKNAEFLLAQLKIFNLFIFIGFGVTVIALIWYKRRKKRKIHSSQEI